MMKASGTGQSGQHGDIDIIRTGFASKTLPIHFMPRNRRTKGGSTNLKRWCTDMYFCLLNPQKPVIRKNRRMETSPAKPKSGDEKQRPLTKATLPSTCTISVSKREFPEIGGRKHSPLSSNRRSRNSSASQGKADRRKENSGN